MVNFMNKKIERQINKLYETIFKKIYNSDVVKSILRGNKIKAKKEVLQLEKSKRFDQIAKSLSKKLANEAVRSTRGIWRKYYYKAKAKNYIALPDTYKKFELKVLEKAIEHNFKMIKTIPQEVLKVEKHKYIETLVAQVARGTISRGEFERQLRNHGHKNAGVIARTETAKLQTTIVHEQAKEIGSLAYIWRSSHDKRTRPSHWAMNDVVVFWRDDEEEKPYLDKMYGNAGEFPNCRCDPHPIVDEEDLNKASYKVYNYKTKKLVTRTKQDVLKMLETGQFF